MGSLKRWLDGSLGRRIAFLVTVLLVLMSLGIALVSYYQVLQLTHQTASERFHLLGRQLADMLGRSPAQSAGSLARLATNPVVVAGVDSMAVDSVFRQSIPPSPRVVLAMLDRSGHIVRRIARRGEPAWFGPDSTLTSDAVRVGPLVVFQDSVLYYDVRAALVKEGRPTGALLERTRVTLSSGSAEALATLAGGDTHFMLGSPTTNAWTDLARIVPAPPAEVLRLDTVLGNSWSWETQRQLGMTQAVPGAPWVLSVAAPTRTIEGPAHRYLGRALLVALLAVVIGTFAAAGLAHRLVAPIREITSVTERIAAGELDSRADENSAGEIGRLAGSFNAMVQKVAGSTHLLRQSEVSLRAFVAHSRQGIWHIEFDPSLDTSLPAEQQIDEWYRLAPELECNDALARMQRYEVRGDICRMPLATLFPREAPESRRLLLEFIAGGYRLSDVPTEGRDVDGARVFVNDLIGLVEDGRLRRIWGTRRDVTVERMLDERLAQSQRLEAIGRLAGGVAHDFNNLLTVIQAHAEMLLEEIPAAGQQRSDVVEIQQTAKRAAQLTRQLLLFSRGQAARPDQIDLNQVVGEVEGMLRRVIGEDIVLTLRLTPDISPIHADHGQLEQVLMNLVVNARDAMPNGGMLELRTGESELDEEYVKLRPTLEPGRYVMLAVTDTGSGMTAKVQQHAFEPFFTTKPKGVGTGLGLATVYGIVHQGGGDVAIYSEVGRGTTVKLFFPAAERLATVNDERPLTGAAPEREGHETVLVIEDEPALRDMVRRALGASGYTVLAAADGPQAIEIFRENSATVDLLLTDMILPGMSGRDLVGVFRGQRPQLPVIIMSGYTGETYPALESLPAGVGYLEKPFSLMELRHRVRESLDAKAVNV